MRSPSRSFPTGFRRTGVKPRRHNGGVFDGSMILGHDVDAVQASQAAAGWGGDRYLVVWQQLRHPRHGRRLAHPLGHASRRGRILRRPPPSTTADDSVQRPRRNRTRYCWTAAVAACQTQSGVDVWWFYGPDSEIVKSLITANLARPAAVFPLPSGLLLRGYCRVGR